MSCIKFHVKSNLIITATSCVKFLAGIANSFNKMCFYKTVNILTVIKLKSSVVKINSNAFKPFNNIIHFISSNNSLFAKHFNMC